MLKRTHVRSAFLVMIATAVLGAPISASSQAADQQEVQQMHQQAGRCHTDLACFEACKSAFEQRDSTEYRGLADKCNELYTVFAQRRDQANADSLDGSILKDGYSWMADVDAVVSSRPIGRQYALVVAGSEDWTRNCTTARSVSYLLDGPAP